MYNHPPGEDEERRALPALAAAVRGDKKAFYDCSFKGVQDTLFDHTGRAITAITATFKNCTIYIKSGSEGRKGSVMAAQKRKSINETNGYVFNGFYVDGIGKSLLGRAYGPYSRAIFANSCLSSVVDPVGWGACDQHDV
ncbi:probable pectinesterase 55 [Prosopis cineraria]|uniref:probable pectinesterase 55 n=1 Tax=Prosopis cineraria TaxID=364024 RepID=UPI00240EB322|nr:probable pectinesterase 55 [Prosopis cineraria]XP_054821845.1 probable pectinesterase 55 [Prosopis cineraria]